MVTVVEVAVLGVSAFTASFVTGLTSFGNAILFQLCMQVAWLWVPNAPHKHDLLGVVILFRAIDLSSTVPLLVSERRNVRWKPLLLLMPPMIAGGYLGVHLLLSTPPHILELVLGFIFLAFGAYKVGEEVYNLVHTLQTARTHHPYSLMVNSEHGEGVATSAVTTGVHGREERSAVNGETSEGSETLTRYTGATGVLAAVSAGVLDGLFGTAGPPLMIWSTLSRLNKALLRATMLAMFGLNSIVLAVYMFVPISPPFLGKFGYVNPWEYLMVVAGALTGAGLGGLLSRFIGTRLFTRLIILLLILASTAMLQPATWVLVTVCGGLVLLLGIFLWLDRQIAQAEGSSDSVQESKL